MDSQSDKLLLMMTEEMGGMNEPLPTYKLFSGVHLALLGKSEPESMFW